MECFYEQFQTKDYKSMEEKLKNISTILIILIIISLVASFLEITILLAIAYVALFFLKMRVIVEYEYELTSYELSIYKIMNKSKRKEMVSFNIKDISSIKKADSNNVKDKNIKVLCLDNTNIEKNIVKAKTKEGLVVLKLAMDDKLIDIIKRVNSLAFY